MKKLFTVLLSLLMILVGGFLLWAQNAADPESEALAALSSTESVTVVQDNLIDFIPRQQTPDTGLILYPGGKVDPRAYAPLAMRLAEQGYLVSIVPMPLNLAMFGFDKASQVIERHPQIRHWAIAGHSLGGVFAAKYTAMHPEQVFGLALWAAYPPSDVNLSAHPTLAVLQIHGSEDLLLDENQLKNSRLTLSPSAVHQTIAGGNHAQFGCYGEQAGDGKALISREEQQDILVRAMLSLMQNKPAVSAGG